MSSIVAASSPTPAEKQGIAVAILGSDGGERVKASLRRTLSADMSSKKWLAQNGFCLSPPPMKKTASSKELFLNPIADDGDEDDDEEEVKVEFDIWSSIVSQAKPGGGEPLPPPYAHPMVKPSASSLSEKSLQICTESLGSETGSDGFSSSSSDAESGNSDRDGDYFVAAAAELRTARKPAGVPAAPARSFPPPIPSLSSRCGGDGAPAMRMRSRRDNGRLVVEAVEVPASPPPNFSAHRGDGRLVLKLTRADLKVDEFTVPNTLEELEDLEEQSDGESESESETETEEEEEEEEEKKVEYIADSRLINFHRLALMANKPIGLPNRNIKEEEDLGDRNPAPAAVAQSLPPMTLLPSGRIIPPPAAAKGSTTAAASFNHYDYFWRAKISASNDRFKSQTTSPNDKREFVVSRGDGNGNGYCLVPLLEGCCKEPRRTFVWQPRCIATS